MAAVPPTPLSEPLLHERSVRSALPEVGLHMAGAWAGHPEPRIPAPGCRLSMLPVGSYLGQSGEEAAIWLELRRLPQILFSV